MNFAIRDRKVKYLEVLVKAGISAVDVDWAEDGNKVEVKPKYSKEVFVQIKCRYLTLQGRYYMITAIVVDCTVCKEETLNKFNLEFF